ncbi:Solute carrier 49 member 4 [Branchiostoma belcheri]|nr:Solute carrier 49 member 4 [Branchiostoma belcheri]
MPGLLKNGVLTDSEIVVESDPLLKDYNGDYNTTYSSINRADSGLPANPAGLQHGRIYKRRWYILGLFSILAATQCMVWNVWGPISDSAKFVFGWEDSDIALLTNWGPIAYIPLAVPFSWLMDVKGLRISVIVTAFLVFAGTAIRCVTAMYMGAATWLMNIGQCLNGMAGPVAMSAPAVLSAAWFPHEQRATATAIGTILGCLGGAGSFIIGPLIVRSRAANHTHTGHHNVSGFLLEEVIRPSKNETEFALSAAIFLATIIYFPDKPPTPPTLTAATERLDFKAGIKQLLKNGRFWLIFLAYGAVEGTYGCWAGILDVNLSPQNITQMEAGWVGFYGSITGGVSGIIIGRVADFMGGHYKLAVLVLTVVLIGSTLWFTFMLYISIIPFNTVSLYASFLLLQVSLLGCVPLFYELSVEASYPIAEGITSGVLTWSNNLFGLLFLLAFYIPNIGTSWMNWTALGTGVGVVPLIFTVLCSVSVGTSWLNWTALGTGVGVVPLIFTVLCSVSVGTSWMNWTALGTGVGVVPLIFTVLCSVSVGTSWMNWTALGTGVGVVPLIFTVLCSVSVGTSWMKWTALGTGVAVVPLMFTVLCSVSVGTSWMNWTALGTGVAVVPLMFTVLCSVSVGTSWMKWTALGTGVAVVPLMFTVLCSVSVGTSWMNWTALGTGVAVVPLMLLFREKYGRLSVDTGQAQNKGVSS